MPTSATTNSATTTTETNELRRLLLPELEAELNKTRRVLENLPDGHNDFKPHGKSMSLAQLAGHNADLPLFTTLILTTPNLDLGAGSSMKSTLMESKVQVLAAFNENADKAITALKNCSDQVLSQPWKLSYKAKDIFSGTRYDAYRTMGVNHLVHHRAQLGVYLRLLDQPVPGTFGPSADEAFPL